MTVSHLHVSAATRALLCAALPAALVVTPAPAIAQQRKPANSVMGLRLSGTWKDDKTDYVFERASGNVRFRWVERATGDKWCEGTLAANPGAGKMEGRMRCQQPGRPAYDGPLAAWIDDARGDLWLEANLGGPLWRGQRMTLTKADARPEQAVFDAWGGDWHTSRGRLGVFPDGTGLIAWLKDASGSRRERVALIGYPKDAVGAWDSEVDAQGTRQPSPIQWGDLQLTLSTDGNGFTGWYTERAGSPGADPVVREWTGERVHPRRPRRDPGAKSPEEVLQKAARWPGRYVSSGGSIVTIRRSGDAMVGTGVGSRGSDSEHFSLAPSLDSLRGTWSAGRQQAALYAAPAQPANLIYAEATAGGSTGSYTLCRIAPAEQRVHSTGGTWVDLRDTRLRNEDDGSTTLFAKVRVLNANDGRRYDPQRLSARLPEHSVSGPLAGYYSPATRADDAPAPYLTRCDATELEFRFRNVTSAARKLVMYEDQSDTAEFDISSVTAGIGRKEPSTAEPSTPPPSSPPPAEAEPAQPAPAAGAFKPLRRVDVRVDRVAVARGYPTHQIHAFVTVRNVSGGPQYFTSGYLKAVLTDGDGVAYERNQPYRASGEPAALFASTPVIQPGGELKVRYVFAADEGFRPASLTLSEGDKRAEFPSSP